MPTNAPRSRVLIVDDSPTNVSILLDALEDEYEISFANSGAEALDLIAHSEAPDLILLDVMMPEMDGYEVCRRLKADPTTRGIPIIFVTAMDSSESESEGLTLGAEDYITKPVNLGIARLRIRNLLERQRLHHELELTLASARQGLWSWDLHSDTVFLDPRWAEALGYRPHELDLPPRPWAAFVHPDDLAAFEAACAAHFAGQAPLISAELRMRNRDDAFIWVQVLGRANPGHGKASRAIGTYADISQRKRDEALIAQQKRHLETLIASIPDLVISIDTEGTVLELHCPEPLHHLLVTAGGEGGHYRSLLLPALGEAIDQAVVACFSEACTQTGEASLGRNGTSRHYAAIVSRLNDSSNWPTGYLILIRDITDTRRTEAELKEMAFHDPLTGLPNRRLLNDRIVQAQRHGQREQRFSAVMLLDLDHFKTLNDQFGHDAGDTLLIEVARRLRSCVREHDTVARLGGDEFVVLLERLGDNEGSASHDARVIAEKITTALDAPFRIGTLEYQSGASIGVRLFCGGEIDAAHLLEQADQAMYREKQRKRQLTN